MMTDAPTVHFNSKGELLLLDAGSDTQLWSPPRLPPIPRISHPYSPAIYPSSHQPHPTHDGLSTPYVPPAPIIPPYAHPHGLPLFNYSNFNPYPPPPPIPPPQLQPAALIRVCKRPGCGSILDIGSNAHTTYTGLCFRCLANLDNETLMMKNRSQNATAPKGVAVVPGPRREKELMESEKSWAVKSGKEGQNKRRKVSGPPPPPISPSMVVDAVKMRPSLQVLLQKDAVQEKEQATPKKRARKKTSSNAPSSQVPPNSTKSQSPGNNQYPPSGPVQTARHCQSPGCNGFIPPQSNASRCPLCVSSSFKKWLSGVRPIAQDAPGVPPPVPANGGVKRPPPPHSATLLMDVENSQVQIKKGSSSSKKTKNGKIKGKSKGGGPPGVRLPESALGQGAKDKDTLPRQPIHKPCATGASPRHTSSPIAKPCTRTTEIQVKSQSTSTKKLKLKVKPPLVFETLISQDEWNDYSEYFDNLRIEWGQDPSPPQQPKPPLRQAETRLPIASSLRPQHNKMDEIKLSAEDDLPIFDIVDKDLEPWPCQPQRDDLSELSELTSLSDEDDGEGESERDTSGSDSDPDIPLYDLFRKTGLVIRIPARTEWEWRGCDDNDATASSTGVEPPLPLDSVQSGDHSESGHPYDGVERTDSGTSHPINLGIAPPPPPEATTTTSPKYTRRCTFRKCQTRLPPFSEYRWKICEPCRVSQRLYQRKRLGRRCVGESGGERERERERSLTTSSISGVGVGRPGDWEPESEEEDECHRVGVLASVDSTLVVDDARRQCIAAEDPELKGAEMVEAAVPPTLPPPEPELRGDDPAAADVGLDQDPDLDLDFELQYPEDEEGDEEMVMNLCLSAISSPMLGEREGEVCDIPRKDGDEKAALENMEIQQDTKEQEAVVPTLNSTDKNKNCDPDMAVPSPMPINLPTSIPIPVPIQQDSGPNPLLHPNRNQPLHPQDVKDEKPSSAFLQYPTFVSLIWAFKQQLEDFLQAQAFYIAYRRQPVGGGAATAAATDPHKAPSTTNQGGDSLIPTAVATIAREEVFSSPLVKPPGKENDVSSVPSDVEKMKGGLDGCEDSLQKEPPLVERAGVLPVNGASQTGPATTEGKLPQDQSQTVPPPPANEINDIPAKTDESIRPQRTRTRLLPAPTDIDTDRANFSFDGEFSTVNTKKYAGDDRVRERMRDIQDKLFWLKTVIQEQTNVGFDVILHMPIMQSEGLIARFSCRHEVVVHYHEGGGNETMARKVMKGQLEIMILPDRSHRFLEGQKTSVRFLLVG